MKPPKIEQSELVSGETIEDQLHGLSHEQLEILRASRWVLTNKRKPPKDLTEVYSVFRGSDDDEESEVAQATMDPSSQVASTTAGATSEQPSEQQQGQLQVNPMRAMMMEMMTEFMATGVLLLDMRHLTPTIRGMGLHISL